MVAASAVSGLSAQNPQESKALAAIRVHREGHYLEKSDGRPFFWLGDTAWTLLHGTTADEASYYLRTRSRQGFTIIQMVALGETTGAAGHNPSMRPFFDEDPAKPNDAYFVRMVGMVDEAANDGLYVALVPAWGDTLTAPWGVGPRFFRLDNLSAARAYGRYLATKLKGRTNLVWMLGGDTPSKLDPGKPNEWPQNQARSAGFSADYDWRPIWREMAAGITSGSDTVPVFLFHPEGEGTTSPNLHQESWLAINGIQSGHGQHDFPVWDWIARDFALIPAKPTLDLEPNYEDHPVHPWPYWDPASGYFNEYDVRKQCYRSVLAGACGVTYGNHAVWGFFGERNEPVNHVDRDWINGMDRPGGRQMIFLRQLIESRPFFSRIPDRSLVNHDSSAAAAHMEASRDREGSYAFIYFPQGAQSATVDLAKLRPGQIRGWWFDPRSGFSRLIGTFEGGASRTFQSPAYGPDWVLVLDSAAADYSAPGQPRRLQPAQ